uniref:Poly [ADP-ribose] polymerase n=1 Tax=Caenorhabditis japonica TaxID=281687 RepID=A0A8R1HPN0_CAEJA
MSMCQPSSFFDGNIDSWYHFECFWQQMRPRHDDINIASIRGVDCLKWDHQNALRERIQIFQATKSPLPQLNHLVLSSLKIEKSATNRGKCFKCSKSFEKGEIKMWNRKWLHAKCLFESVDRVVDELEAIPGWQEQEEQFRIKVQQVFDEIIKEKKVESFNKDSEILEEMQSSSNNILTLSDSPRPHVLTNQEIEIEQDEDDLIIIEEKVETPSRKLADKRKMGKEAKLAELRQKRMKKQADRLWDYRQKFENMSCHDRRLVLEFNDQDIPEGHDPTAQLLDRLVDNAVFGCPIGCPQCPNGKIVYDSAQRTYVCTGFATEYTRCQYKSKNPTRTPFKLPEKLYRHFKDGVFVFNEMSERLYVEEEEKNGTVVDAKFHLAKNCHVYKNETDGSLFQATLSYTDVTLNKNSFYKIQLLKDDLYEHYYVFRSWGRVGTDVGDTKSDFFVKEVAIEVFQKTFYEKTKNEWKYRKHFRKMPGCFNFVETDFTEFEQQADEEVTPSEASRLPESVKQIVASIFNIENMKSALQSFEMDVNKMPLGKLSTKQIRQAYDALSELGDLLAEHPIRKDKVLDVTNKFYTLIPHNFGMKVPEPIDSLHKIKEKNNMLTSLLDIKYAYDQICGSKPSKGIVGRDPVDVNYEKLKCIMTGLRIAPPEAPVSGYMFGKGVYFADMFTKSFFYCRANNHEEAYLLLCDVALGSSNTLTQATTMSLKTLPVGTSSVKGMGREFPNERGNFCHPDGYLIPKGIPMSQKKQGLSLIYNEYIVYDVNQIQLKYLVRVRLNQARRLE